MLWWRKHFRMHQQADRCQGDDDAQQLHFCCTESKKINSIYKYKLLRSHWHWRVCTRAATARAGACDRVALGRRRGGVLADGDWRHNQTDRRVGAHIVAESRRRFDRRRLGLGGLLLGTPLAPLGDDAPHDDGADDQQQHTCDNESDASRIDRRARRIIVDLAATNLSIGPHQRPARTAAAAAGTRASARRRGDSDRGHRRRRRGGSGRCGGATNGNLGARRRRRRRQRGRLWRGRIGRTHGEVQQTQHTLAATGSSEPKHRGGFRERLRRRAVQPVKRRIRKRE